MKIKTNQPAAPRRVLRRFIPSKIMHARAAASDKEIEDYEGEAEPNMKLSHAFFVVLILHVLAVGGVFAFNAIKTRQIVSGHSVKPPIVADASPRQELPAKKENTLSPTAPNTESKPTPKSVVSGVTHTVVPGDTLTRIATQHKTTVETIEQANDITSTSTIHVGQVLNIPSPAQAVKTTSTPPPTKPAIAATPVAKTSEVKQTVSPVATDTKIPTNAPVKTTPAPAAKEPSSSKIYVVAKGDNPYSIAKKLKVNYNELIKTNKIEDPTKLQIGQKLIIP